MGSLASIAASRVARFLGAGGPSFAVCDELAGGLRAISLAVEALRNGEIDRALAGAVDLTTDARKGGTWDGAAAVILKRLSDAERDGDRVYMLVHDIRPIRDDAPVGDRSGAAFHLADIIDTCRKLASGLGLAGSRFLISDRADEPLRLSKSAWNVGGDSVEVELDDYPDRFVRSQPSAPALAHRPDGLFTLSGDSAPELEAELDRLAELADGEPKPAARSWWFARRGRPAGKLGLAFVAQSTSEFRQCLATARRHLHTRPNESIADGMYYAPNPLGGEVAFVYPGSGNHFAGMGAELAAAFPHALWRQMAESVACPCLSERVGGAKSAASAAATVGCLAG